MALLNDFLENGILNSNCGEASLILDGRLIGLIAKSMRIVVVCAAELECFCLMVHLLHKLLGVLLAHLWIKRI